MKDADIAAETRTSSGRVKADRLAKEDWLEAGLTILGKTGPGGLRIDQACRAMKVTKGSFYWHFQDRRAFLDGLIAHWRSRDTTGLIDHVEGHFGAPADRIRHVATFVTSDDYDAATELAMRQWAQADTRVRETLEQIDAERLAFFQRQFAAAGFDETDARLRALTIYSLTLSSAYMLSGESKADLCARLNRSLDLMLVPGQ